MSETLKVGDSLWFVYSDSRRGRAHEIVVRSVGRKWADVSPPDWDRISGRIAISDLVMDGKGCTSPGQAYRDRELYEASVERSKAWDAFRQEFSRVWRCPDHLTLADIVEMRERVLPRPINVGELDR